MVRGFVKTDGHRYRNGGIVRISSGSASVVGFSLNRLVSGLLFFITITILF
jgi:hypothetical protein